MSKTRLYLLNKVEHDSFGNHVDHGSLDDVVVRRDEQLCLAH